ncbi:MAG TPA: nucleoside deaminase [Candidatus Saccharimonadales bacterium]|nr:nucleoside deaminase [Candidatus Saccharimonadales bacterium]
MKDDQYYLRIATDEGNKNSAPYNFGAVVVKDGEIVAQDHNHVHENLDPSAHSEVSTIRKAAKKLENYNLDGCTLYCSHEPCIMCFSCAAWANIERIVYAIPASEQNEFSYEFRDVSLKDLVKKLVNRPIKVELVRLT